MNELYPTIQPIEFLQEATNSLTLNRPYLKLVSGSDFDVDTFAHMIVNDQLGIEEPASEPVIEPFDQWPIRIPELRFPLHESYIPMMISCRDWLVKDC
jgi:hypothetical protein